MIVLSIFITILFVASFVYCIISDYQIDKKHKNNIENGLNQLIYPPKPFSISEYYDRIEKINVDILSKKENQNHYKITLWAGLDGLQLNDDGSTEWIKRGENKKEITPLNDGLQNVNTSFTGYSFQNMNTIDSIQSQINSLQYQNQHLMMQQASQAQIQNLISSMVNSFQTNHYLPYYPQMIYAQNLTQCCCSSSLYGCNNVYW